MSKNSEHNDEKIEKEIEKFIERVSDFFDEETVEKKARESKFVQRESDITGHIFLTVFTFAVSVYGTPTLDQLAGILHSVLPEIDVSRISFHHRINEYAVEFFTAMLSLAIELEVPKIKLSVMDVFERILIFDSTSFQLPDTLEPFFKGSGGGATKSAIKITFGYDLKSAQFFYTLLDGTNPDHLINNGMMDEIGANDLVLVDLGYFGIPAFAEIKDKRAFVLSRLKSNITLYQINEGTGELEKFDFLDFLQNMPDTLVEIEVYLKTKDVAIKMRLVIEKVPDKVKAQRLRKLNETYQKKGRQPKKRTRILQGFNLHITNAPAKSIPTKSVRELYAIRWQIELIFKIWKSNFKLAKVNGVRPERIKSMIYAKLLFIFITSKITRLASIYTWNKYEREVSEFQAARHFEVLGSLWFTSIIKRPDDVKDILLNAFYYITKHCLKCKSKKRTYPIETLASIQAMT